MEDADREIIATMIHNAISAQVSPVVRCTAENPHDTLVYQRGPNIYRCRCGEVYQKNGRGGLMISEVD